MHVYSPGAGEDSPQGTKFWCQQKDLITLPICFKFQRNLFEVCFYTFFFMILYMCIAPRQGLTAPWGRNVYINRNILSLRSKFWCQQKGLITLPICCKFQRNLFELWFYTLFSWFKTCIYPRDRGHTAPQGTKFWCQRKLFVTLVIWC